MKPSTSLSTPDSCCRCARRSTWECACLRLGVALLRLEVEQPLFGAVDLALRLLLALLQALLAQLVELLVVLVVVVCAAHNSLRYTLDSMFKTLVLHSKLHFHHKGYSNCIVLVQYVSSRGLR